MSLPLIAELRRRRVFRALVGYGIAAFAVLQIIEPIMHGLHWPDEVLSSVVVALAIGFPIVVSLAWIFDVNSGRIERTSPAVPALGLRGARLALLLAGIGVLAAAPGVAWYFLVHRASKPPMAEGTASVAVLPFLNLSGESENEYFSDGLTEELLNALAQVPGLRVAARTSAFQFKGKAADVHEVGSRLSVGHVLEGSVRRTRDHLRVTAQLVKTSDGYQVWSETYDRELKDIFAVQEEVSRAIAHTLALRIAPALPVHEPPFEAHEAFLRGRFWFYKGTEEGTGRALGYYQQAIARDPDYAQAWAAIAEANLWLGDEFRPALEVYPRAMEAARRAIAIDARSSEGHLFLAFALFIFERDFPAAAEEYRKAESDAASFHLYYSHYREVVAGPEAGLQELRRAVELDPLNPMVNGISGWVYVWGRRFDRALEQQRRTDELEPEWFYLGSVAGEAYRELGRYPEAIEAYRREEKSRRRPSWGLGVTFARMGRTDEARQIAGALEARFVKTRLEADRIAAVYVALGDLDTAFAWLDRAVEMRTGMLTFIRLMPEFDGIRSDARYPGLLRRLGWNP